MTPIAGRERRWAFRAASDTFSVGELTPSAIASPSNNTLLSYSRRIAFTTPGVARARGWRIGVNAAAGRFGAVVGREWRVGGSARRTRGISGCSGERHNRRRGRGWPAPVGRSAAFGARRASKSRQSSCRSGLDREGVRPSQRGTRARGPSAGQHRAEGRRDNTRGGRHTTTRTSAAGGPANGECDRAETPAGRPTPPMRSTAGL